MIIVKREKGSNMLYCTRELDPEIKRTGNCPGGMEGRMKAVAVLYSDRKPLKREM